MSGRYDDSEAALWRQVDVTEIDELLKAGPRQFLKDSSKLVHLLNRMRTTLVLDHETVQGLRRHINEQSEHLARLGTPTTLNPLDALKFLNDDQKERIFDRISRDRLKNLRELVARAQADHARVAGELELVRDLARSLSQMADLPPHVRAEATRSLAALPDSPSPVHYPPILDYPDPEPTFEHTPVLDPPAAAPAFTAPPHVPSPETTARPVFVDPYGPA